MSKKYSDRSMAVGEPKAEEVVVEGELFFFPKETPPVSIRAKSRQEAEEILAARKKQ